MRQRLANDLVSGATSSVVVAIIGIIATPVYLAMLGQESYGVFAFYIALSGILTALDLGLPVTLNRLVAQTFAKPTDKQSLSTIVWGTVATFWVQALLIVSVVGALSWWLATEWLQLRSLSASYVQEAVLLAALAIAVRWPTAVYQALLMGANRLVLANVTAIALTLMTTVGSLAILHWVKPDLRLMFGWFAVSGAIHVAWLHMCARAIVPGRADSTSAAPSLKAFVLDSAPVALTGVIGVLLTQSDKLILSKLVSLDSLGHYVLATLVASAIYAAVTPLSNALYPRFSALAARGDSAGLSKLYRLSCHGLAAVLFPIAMLLCISGEDLVLLWTGNSAVAAAVAPILQFLVVGSALHGIMFITYAVSIGSGLQRLVLKLNVLTLIVALPLTWLFALWWGARGAAGAWFVVHATYFLVSAKATHKYVIPGFSWRWLSMDVGLPAGISAGVGLLALTAMESFGGSRTLTVWHGIALVVVCWGCMLATSSRLRVLCKEVIRWVRPIVA